MKSLYFFLYLGVILSLLDPDPDPATQITADPDLDPQPWICIMFVVEYLTSLGSAEPSEGGEAGRYNHHPEADR
jgi:hypothetical protein